jgi:hypothetical protein
MVLRRALLVIGIVVGCSQARADDMAPTAQPPALGNTLLRDPRVQTPPPTLVQDVSVWPPKPPEARVPVQPAQVYEPYNLEAPPAAPPPMTMTTVVPALPLVPRLVESTWYTRFDYFHWSERLDGANFVTENGPLFTLGYQRRIGPERFRAELFGSQVHYASTVFFNDGTSAPLTSTTDYLGARAEYDYLFQPDWPPPVNFFAGIGTRFWIRNLPDMTDAFGDFIRGYQETWWTVYPYLGMESRRNPGRDVEFYGRGRVGLMAVTFEHLTLHETTLFPGPGVTSQLELGFRGDYLFLAGYAEIFTWRQSGEARGLVQPSSLLLTVGLKSGVSF